MNIQLDKHSFCADFAFESVYKQNKWLYSEEFENHHLLISKVNYEFVL